MGLNAKYQDKFCLTVLGPHQWAHSAQISSEMTRMGSMLLIHTFSSRLKLPMATGMALSLYHGMMLRICPNLASIFPFFLCTERMFWEGGKKKLGVCGGCMIYQLKAYVLSFVFMPFSDRANPWNFLQTWVNSDMQMRLKYWFVRVGQRTRYSQNLSVFGYFPFISAQWCQLWPSIEL